MNTLKRLTQWYLRHCNGEWEHGQGVSIESCDNPGWWVKIALAGTELQLTPFVSVSENVDDNGFQKADRWLHCRVQDGVWEGAGDETQLERILELFLNWAEGSEATDSKS
jgi:hypothetical protein